MFGSKKFPENEKPIYRQLFLRMAEITVVAIPANIEGLERFPALLLVDPMVFWRMTPVRGFWRHNTAFICRAFIFR